MSDDYKRQNQDQIENIGIWHNDHFHYCKVLCKWCFRIGIRADGTFTSNGDVVTKRIV